jgi:hypothetical protein
MSEAIISTWTIYENPLDHPGKFVVRRWDVLEGRTDPVPADEAVVVKTLGMARMAVPAGSVCLGRQPGDDPAILETWI